jgi:hypothetical protein
MAHHIPPNNILTSELRDADCVLLEEVSTGTASKAVEAYSKVPAVGKSARPPECNRARPAVDNRARPAASASRI